MNVRTGRLRQPNWFTILLGALAAAGGVVALLFGLLIFAVRITPDTGHGEDLGGLIAFLIILPILAISALLGLGCGIGGFALSTGRARLAPTLGMTFTVIGICLAAAPFRA